MKSLKMVLVLCSAAFVFGGAANAQKPSQATNGKPLPCPPGTTQVTQTIPVKALPSDNGEFPPGAATGPLAGVNDASINKHFLGEFTWKPELPCCQVTKCSLKVQMKSNQPGTVGGANAANDNWGVYVGGILQVGGRIYPNINFPKDTQSNKSWTCNAKAIENLNVKHHLSLYVQDDTKVEVPQTALLLTSCCIK